jgi:hypothetical protein
LRVESSAAYAVVLAMSTDLVSVLVPTIAGLVGAGVGGLASYRAATGAAKTAAQSEQRVWVRQRREAAYLSLLTARDQWVAMHVEKGSAMQEWVRAHPKPPYEPQFDFAAYQAKRLSLEPQLEIAVNNVELFGSENARKAAQLWQRDLGDYLIATRPGGAFGAGVGEIVRLETAKHREPFVALVRGELGIES